jgi:hypothetical protein
MALIASDRHWPGRIPRLPGVEMSFIPSFAWLSNFSWRVARPTTGRDFADMGTAFGLDASMDDEPAPAPARIGAARAGAHKKGRSETGAPQQRLSREGSRELR